MHPPRITLKVDLFNLIRSQRERSNVTSLLCFHVCFFVVELRARSSVALTTEEEKVPSKRVRFRRTFQSKF